jgi:UDP-N-acetylglucosamine 2-epimerase (non-hydrolysing)
MNIVSVVGARPQFIKLKPVHEAIMSCGLTHTILHTGQHYDKNMSDVFFQGLNLPAPDANLGMGTGSHGEMTGKMLVSVEEFFLEKSPDFVLVYGDTNSTMAAALAAAKIRIPLGHIEAGLRSNNREMPEEINRIVTDHVSDLLFAPTELAMNNLDKEGLADSSFLTGDVMADLIYELLPQLSIESGSSSLAQERDYFVTTIHRASNTDSKQQLSRLINAIHALPKRVVIVAHPRLLAKAASFGIQLNSSNVSTIEPLPYLDMLRLIYGSSGLITDSGGLQKESFLLGVPCVTLRAETEWPETLEQEMNVLNPDGGNLYEIVSRNTVKTSSKPYGDGNAAKRIATLLMNYSI